LILQRYFGLEARSARGIGGWRRLAGRPGAGSQLHAGAAILDSRANKTVQAQGTDLAEAIRHAAILRLRPIMMTALVAALGLLPVALATGVGTDSQRPFALVIVSGLFSRLLISVFLMPVLYSLIARPGDRLQV
jgi:Cu/Ag efflux pump CusA